jgi:hypothetical protein
VPKRGRRESAYYGMDREHQLSIKECDDCWLWQQMKFEYELSLRNQRDMKQWIHTINKPTIDKLNLMIKKKEK